MDAMRVSRGEEPKIQAGHMSLSISLDVWRVPRFACPSNDLLQKDIIPRETGEREPGPH